MEVGGELFQWDVLLWAAWSVWEARVVGTWVVLVGSIVIVAGSRTEEYGKKTDVLLSRLRNRLMEDLVLSVAGCIVAFAFNGI